MPSHYHPSTHGEYPNYLPSSKPYHHHSHHQPHPPQHVNHPYGSDVPAHPLDDYHHHPYHHPHHPSAAPPLSLRHRYSSHHHPSIHYEEHHSATAHRTYPEPPLVLADGHASIELRNVDHHHPLHDRSEYMPYTTTTTTSYPPIRSYRPPNGGRISVPPCGADGPNIAIVQPSFDEQDAMMKGTKTPSPKRRKNKNNHLLRQSPRPSADRKVIVTDETSDRHNMNRNHNNVNHNSSPVSSSSSSSTLVRRRPQEEERADDDNTSAEGNTTATAAIVRHKRNLSTQFYDTTEDATLFPVIEYSVKDSTTSGSGDYASRHRRIFSRGSDTLEDLIKHRRIHSITDSPTLMNGSGNNTLRHERHDSAGLDILSAAIAADAMEQDHMMMTTEPIKHHTSPPYDSTNTIRHVPWDPAAGIPVPREAPTPVPRESSTYHSLEPQLSRLSHPLLSAADHPHMHPPVPRSSSSSMGPPPLPVLPYPPSRHYPVDPSRPPPRSYHPISDTIQPSSYQQHGYYSHPHHPSIPQSPMNPPPPHSYYHGNFPPPPPKPSPIPPLHPSRHHEPPVMVHIKSPTVLSSVANRKTTQMDKSYIPTGKDTSAITIDHLPHPLASKEGSAAQGINGHISDGNKEKRKGKTKLRRGKKEEAKLDQNKTDDNNTILPPHGSSSPLRKTTKQQQHHRKNVSSFSCVGGAIFGAFSPDYLVENNNKQQHPLLKTKQKPIIRQGEKSTRGGPHHRASSSVSFTKVLDSIVSHENDVFLRNLQQQAALPPGERSPIATTTRKVDDEPRVTTSSSPPPIPPTLHVPTLEANTADDGDHLSSNEEDDEYRIVTVGGTNKRVRRKCTVAGCRNRVVQGGLCITHGAKRKTCQHPGCTKKVKKAGLCSSHGPARKRCEAPGCHKVAVQRGKCIAHGAKKKLCKYPDCPKQAILRGMCKKHHDLQKIMGLLPKTNVGSATDHNMNIVNTTTIISSHDASNSLAPTTTSMTAPDYCVEVGTTSKQPKGLIQPPAPLLLSAKSSSKKVTKRKQPQKPTTKRMPPQKQKGRHHKPTHTRGLSIFHDISADTVSSILNNPPTTTTTTAPTV